ncbi:MAG: hypothetical protein IJW67_11630 [Blautia sp.]|nr:hypothetical protein [Blautia sp.]
MARLRTQDDEVVSKRKNLTEKSVDRINYAISGYLKWYKCPICGEDFYMTCDYKDWGYKYTDVTVIPVCSYKCMRKADKPMRDRMKAIMEEEFEIAKNPEYMRSNG